MASPSTVMKCLSEFSMNFNRKGDYVDTMAARWCKAFESTPDKALIAAVQAVCERTFTYPPTLGDVVGATKKAVADMLGHRDSGKGLKRYQFCDECRERKGSCLLLPITSGPLPTVMKQVRRMGSIMLVVKIICVAVLIVRSIVGRICAFGLYVVKSCVMIRGLT